MLRSLPRAGPSSLYLRSHLRPAPRTSKIPIPVCTATVQQLHSSHATPQHAISNPTLANIEKRWEFMPHQEQAELWTALRDRMKTDWHELTIQEKKASYWIAFGPHGPRALDPPGEGWIVFKIVAKVFIMASIVFAITRVLARPAPKTMNKQYQEMTNEYLRRQRTEPITGVSSEGYKGKGMVQSKPRRGEIPKNDDDE